MIGRRSIHWFLAFLLMPGAGCFERPPAAEGPGPDPIPLPPFSAFQVDAGTAVLVRPIPGEGDTFAVDANRNITYPAGLVTEPAYECGIAAMQNGWIGGAVGTFPLGMGDYVGSRGAPIGNSWTAIQYRAVQGQFSVLAFGFPPEEGDVYVLLGSDAVGAATSVISASSEGPAEIVAEVNYWCLNGVSRFDGGTYLVTNLQAVANDLTWSNHFTNGLLMRVEADLDNFDWALVGPDGSRFEASSIDQSDQTFCSDQAGEWTLEVNQLEASRAWGLLISAVDVQVPGFPCDEGWAPSVMA